MTASSVFTREQLLDRLRQGPLRSEDWATVATSRASLKVRIHILRRLGFVILSDPLPRTNRRQGLAPVAYRLIAEPAASAQRAA